MMIVCFCVCAAVTAPSFCLCCVKVESWCPVLPGRVIPSAVKQNSAVRTKAKEEVCMCSVYWGVVSKRHVCYLYRPALPEVCVLA